jgi:tRNA threonylcarbamoyladenosine biosynthesis protein TsaB
MSKILCIDTATDVCSIAITSGTKVEFIRESGNERSHAVQLAVYIDELLKEVKTSVDELDAIAISRGPGSYTGLRIGVSTAKGLCYGGNLPLISVSTLQSMCYGIPQEFIEEKNLSDFYFAPMLDARRMEVYTSVYNSDYSLIQGIKAEIINESSYLNYLENKPVLFFGEGAPKTKEILNHPNAVFYDHFKHSAKYMAIIAIQKLKEQKFEDVAYFEPFYLKDFITTTSKKNILFPDKNSRG